MSETARRRDLRTVPIYHRRPLQPASGGSARLAWALFLVLGIPFLLMSSLIWLAQAGIVIGVLSPLWEPWPPELLKPLLGVAVFAATLAYLAFRTGHRAGFRAGTGVGLAAARAKSEARPTVLPPPEPAPEATAETPVTPPPPPPAE